MTRSSRLYPVHVYVGHLARQWLRRHAIGPYESTEPAGTASIVRLAAALSDRYRIERELGAGRHGHGLPRRTISSIIGGWR